jgi:serine/threonine protein kinase
MCPVSRLNCGDSIMEYCPLGDLKHYINVFANRGKMIPEAKIWEILEQLTMALFRCHNGYNHHRDLAGKHGSALYSDSPRFFHRDLKPENSKFPRPRFHKS